jgi:hypothetical protein
MKRTLPFLLLLAACGSPPKKEEGVLLAAELESPAVEGEIGRFHVRIRNSTTAYLVLRDLAPEGSSRLAAWWQTALPGKVEYEAGPDRWTYDRKTKDVERPVFNRGLLCPGEEIAFKIRVRLLDLPRTFVLRLYAYDVHELARRVYFERRDENLVRFVRLIGRDLETRLLPSPEKDKASHRLVVFPYAEQVATPPEERKLELKAELRRRTFPLEAALAKAGLSAHDEHTFYSGLELWVIRAGEKAWLVNSARAIELPRIPDLQGLFYLLDATEHPKVEVEFLKETKTLFAADYALVSDASRKRFYAFLPRNELVPFFEKVRDHGLILEAEMTEGGGRLKVTR